MASFHEGEIAIQEQAGVKLMANRVGRGIHPFIFDSAIAFLHDLSFIVVASRDANQHLWASFLTGTPGFLAVTDSKTLLIKAQPRPDDPLSANLENGQALGLLAIDFASRLRLRLNGTLADRTPDRLVIAAQEVYANCPKYIQARDVIEVNPLDGHSMPPIPARHTTALNPEQQSWIAQADTFFIASAHPNGGADASHRGGNPGFVRLIDERTLIFPDYSGNMMFNTLGNLAVNPSAGLLFPDFAADRTLQLTGRAEVLWDQAQIASFPGAQRVVRFEIDEIVDGQGSLGLPFGAPEYSHFNPS